MDGYLPAYHMDRKMEDFLFHDCPLGSAAHIHLDDNQTKMTVGWRCDCGRRVNFGLFSELKRIPPAGPWRERIRTTESRLEFTAVLNGMVVLHGEVQIP